MGRFDSTRNNEHAQRPAKLDQTARIPIENEAIGKRNKQKNARKTFLEGEIKKLMRELGSQ